MVVKRKMIKPGGPASKFQPNWEGPFVVKEAYPGNAYKLINSDEWPVLKKVLPLESRELIRYLAHSTVRPKDSNI